MRISDSKALSFLSTNSSCGSLTCYYTIDMTTISIPPPYSVEVATISNGQMGPYSLALKSAGETTQGNWSFCINPLNAEGIFMYMIFCA